jgi:hypothetical protein
MTKMAKKDKKTKSELVESIRGLVEDAINLTTEWEDNQAKFSRMLYRVKKDKTFPFVGCANLRMPTIETNIRKVKAALVNVIFGIRPIVQVVPTPSGNWESALKIEKFLDHLIMDKIRIKPKSVIGIDQACEKGFYLFKPYWNTNIITRVEKLNIDDLSMEEAMFIFDVNTPPEAIKQAIAQKYDVDMSPLVAKENDASLEKIIASINKGDKKIDVEFQDVICNYPDIALAEPERVYVPTDSGYHPESCSWIIHEFDLPLETLRINSKVKGWNIGDIIENVEAQQKKTVVSLGGSSRDKDIDDDKDSREGISILEKTNKVRVWEYYGWFDINDDGVDEKCVITIAPDFDKVLRKIALPFYSGKYPFVKLFYELTDDRWFSHRGIPEIIEDIVKEIDMQHNMKLDSQTMRNAPMYIYRAGMINKNTMQFAWGQGIAAQGMQPLNDLIQPINNNNPNVEFSYKDEQMLLETKVQELLGQPDYTLQSMINRRQPRTLGEVQMQSQGMQNMFTLDADLFRQSFEELFNWIWDLWCQYGDEQYEFAYFGRNGYEPIKMTREETQGKYKISIRGNDQNTNPQVRLQKTQMIIQMQSNQVALQTGVITPINIANGYKLALQEMDIPNWEELVMPPEMIAQQMQQPQPPPVTDIKIKTDDLTDGELAQILEKRGIKPDMENRLNDKVMSKAERRLELTNLHSDIKNKESDDMKKLVEMATVMQEPKEPREPKGGG